MIKKIYYTWENFDKDIIKIKEYIKKQKWQVDAIYAIPRGGLILGTVLSNHLNVPLYIKSDDIESSRIPINHILIVDDISDRGETLLDIEDIYDFKTITLFTKKGTKFVSNYFCNACKLDEWIVYPWEAKNGRTERDGTEVK